MIFCSRFAGGGATNGGVIYGGDFIRGEFPDGWLFMRNILLYWGLYTKRRGIIFSMSKNVAISFADAIATIWNIVYDQNTSKKSVKLLKQDNF